LFTNFLHLEFYNQDNQGAGAPIDVSADKLSHFRKDVKEVVRKVEEREALVKLMCEIELILERKDALLEAIDEFSKALKHALENGDVLDSVSTKSDPLEAKKKDAHSQFQLHSTWLQSNLKLTNRALASALTQLQIIYGNGYTGFSTFQSRKKNTETIPNDQYIDAITTGKDSNCSEHYHAMEMLAFDVGDDIAAKVISPDSSDKNTNMAKNDYIQGMTAPAGGLLVIADLLTEMMQPSKEMMQPSKEMMPGLATLVMRALLDQLKPEPMQNLPEEADEILRSREVAYNTLTNAVNMLLAELTANGKE
jgi:hypothetical protein